MLNTIKRSKLFLKRNYCNVIYGESQIFTHEFNTKTHDKFNIKIRLLIGWYVEQENTKRLHKNVRVLHKFNSSLIEPHHNVIYDSKLPYHNLIYDKITIEESMIVYINNEIKELAFVMDVDELYRNDFALMLKNRIERLLYLCGVTIDLVHNSHMNLIEKNNE